MASVWWLEGYDERTTWVGRAVARLEELVPFGGHERKETWTTYLPHAIYVAGLTGTVDETVRASLLDRVGRCQASLGQYAAAEGTRRQKLQLDEKVFGAEHPDTLTSMSNLAGVLDSLGKYEESEAMNRQTLAQREKVLGPEHPDTLMSINNLALVLDRQGKYEESEAMNRQTLAICEKAFGPEHPDTLMSIGKMARGLSRQG